MWGLLSTIHAPINANDNSENKLYFCLGLLANLAYLMRPVDYRSILFVICDPFYTSHDVIPLVDMYACCSKQNLFKFDVF